MKPTEFALDGAHIRHAFDRAASSYDQAAALQRQVAERLVSHLHGAPQSLLDLGCGTGYATALFAERFPAAQCYALDLAPGMLKTCRQRLPPVPVLCAEAAQLPLQTEHFDWVVSNLMLQWCNPPVRVLAEIFRCLVPGGQLLLSTFGPATLQELRASFADASPHVSSFPTQAELTDALASCGFVDIECDAHVDMLFYPEVKKLLHELKALGATNAAAGRKRGLMGKQRWQQMIDNYETLRTEQGLPASYPTLILRARKPAKL